MSLQIFSCANLAIIRAVTSIAVYMSFRITTSISQIIAEFTKIWQFFVRDALCNSFFFFQQYLRIYFPLSKIAVVLGNDKTGLVQLRFKKKTLRKVCCIARSKVCTIHLKVKERIKTNISLQFTSYNTQHKNLQKSH